MSCCEPVHRNTGHIPKYRAKNLRNAPNICSEYPLNSVQECLFYKLVVFLKKMNTAVRFTLNSCHSSTRIIEFRGFRTQFSTNFHEILHTLFSIHVVTTLRVSRSFDKSPIVEVRPFDMIVMRRSHYHVKASRKSHVWLIKLNLIYGIVNAP